MRVVPVDEVDPDAWDALSNASPDAWLFHTREWVDIEKKFFNMENFSCALERGGRLCGLLPIYAGYLSYGSFTERVVSSGLHRCAGLALTPSMTMAEIAQARAAGIQELRRIAGIVGAHRIQFGEQSLSYVDLDGVQSVPWWVREYGFHFGLGYGPQGLLPAPNYSFLAVDQIVDLRANENALFSTLEEPCRRAVRKAEKAGVRVVQLEGPARVETYLNLATQSAVRTGESVMPMEYFIALNESSRFTFLFAYVKDEPVGALLLGCYKNKATYLGGVTTSDGLNVRASDFLQWKAICQLAHMGFERYRLGPFFPEAPKDWPIAKISKFKTRFGAAWVPLRQGSYFLDPLPYLEMVVKQYQALLPDRDDYDSAAGQSSTRSWLDRLRGKSKK